MSIFLLDSAILERSPFDKFLSKVKTFELMSLKLSYIKSLIEKSFWIFSEFFKLTVAVAISVSYFIFFVLFLFFKIWFLHPVFSNK